MPRPAPPYNANVADVWNRRHPQSPINKHKWDTDAKLRKMVIRFSKNKYCNDEKALTRVHEPFNVEKVSFWNAHHSTKVNEEKWHACAVTRLRVNNFYKDQFIPNAESNTVLCIASDGTAYQGPKVVDWKQVLLLDGKAVVRNDKWKELWYDIEQAPTTRESVIASLSGSMYEYATSGKPFPTKIHSLQSLESAFKNFYGKSFVFNSPNVSEVSIEKCLGIWPTFEGFSKLSNQFQWKNRIQTKTSSDLSFASVWDGSAFGTSANGKKRHAKKIRSACATIMLQKKFKYISYGDLSFYFHGLSAICSQFKVSLAKALYSTSRAETILDLCAGWGDRLLAFFACYFTKRYIGCDPNESVFAVYQTQCAHYDRWRFVASGHEIGEYKEPSIHWNSESKRWSFTSESTGLSVDLFCRAQEDVDWKVEIGLNAVDLFLTSPPYHQTELYASNQSLAVQQTQSWFRYKSLDEWKHKFLVSLMNNACSMLKFGGIFMLNIADNTKFPTATFISDYMHSQKDFEYKGMYKMTLSHRMITKEKKIKRYEPIWVYQKTLCQ